MLGVPSLAPKRMQWDRVIFERRLEGANVVILPFMDVLLYSVRLMPTTPEDVTGMVIPKAL